MKKLITLLIISLFLLNFSTQAQDELKQAVVKIANEKTSGTSSCFYLSDGGKLYVLTANHVVSYEGILYKNITASFIGSDIDYPVTVYKQYEDIDIAVLQIKNPPNISVIS